MSPSPILMPGKRLALHSLQPCTMPIVHAEEPSKVKTVCGKQSEELFCKECWNHIPGDVRRAFNAERTRMRKLGILKTTPVMKGIIAQCIIQGAQKG